MRYDKPQRLQRGRLGLRLAWACAVICGLFFFLIASLAVLPRVPIFKQRLLFFADRQASLLLSCTVTIGAVYLDIGKGLILKDITVSDPRRKNSPITAELITARPSLGALIRGRLELRSIKISGLNRQLVNGRRGLFAGPIDLGAMMAPVNPAPSAATIQPMVRLLKAERCTVSFIDSITTIAARETIHSAHLKFFRADSMSFVMHAGAGRFSSPVWSGSVRVNDVQGTLGPSSLIFTKAEARGDSALFSLHGTIPFSMDKPWDVTAYAEAFVADIPGTYKNAPLLKSVGKFKTSATMTGSLEHPVLSAAITGYGLRADALKTDSLFLQARYFGNRLNGTAKFWSPYGFAETAIRADITRLLVSPLVGTYSIKASAKNIDTRNFMPRQWRNPPAFHVDADLYAAGSGLKRFPDTMFADIRELSAPPPARPINATIRVAANMWDLTVAMKPDFKAMGNGRYGENGAIDGSFHVQADTITAITSFFYKESIRGSMQADASIIGTFSKPVVSATVHIGKCSYGSYHADTVSAHCRYADQNIQWQSLLVKLGASALSGDGMVSWAHQNVSVRAGGNATLGNHAAGTFSSQARFTHDSTEASVTLTDLNPTVLSPWFPQAKQLQGSLGMRGTLSGPSKNPDMRMTFSFDRPISNNLVIAATGDLSFHDAVLTTAAKVAQTGTGMPFIITAHIPVSMRELSKGLAAVGDGASVTISGEQVAYGGLIGTLYPSVQSAGNISLHGGALKTGGRWTVSCSTHIAYNKLTIKRDEISVGHGVLDMSLSGPLMRPVAHFILSGDSIEYRGNLVESYRGAGSMDSGLLKIDTFHISAGTGRAELSASAPIPWKNGFSFGKNSRVSAMLIALPLSIMQPFIPDPLAIHNGEISGKVIIEGADIGGPRAAGSLSLRNGEVSIYECDKTLDSLSMDLDLKNDSIVMRRLQAVWGGGRVAGSGFAALGAQGVLAARSDIKCNNVHVAGCYENADLGIQTADITIAKDSLISIKADVLLAKTRFTQDFSLIDIAQRIKKSAPRTLRPRNPLFDGITMKITVNCNGNLTFDSNVGKMLIDGSITAAGRPDRPSIAGQLQILNGYVYYLDRNFTITQGTIRQYDPQRINPVLDFSATSVVPWYQPQGGKNDYDITLLIKGDLSDPIITLSAVPSLSQPQIISLLTLGTIQTGMGTDLGSRTGSMVSGQLAGLGARKLARLINVESVDIYGNVFGPSSTGPQLSVTKQVSSRVAVTYTTGLSKLSQQMLQVSYRILRFLYLEAQTDQQAQGGIDLKFRYSR